MKHKHLTGDMMELMEQEMLFMWQSGEAKHILKNDPRFIEVVLSAIFYQKGYWKEMGLEYGEG
jgi:hypothetical protein